MKKVLFAVALVMGLGSSVAFAGNMVSDVEIVVMVNDYKPIEVKRSAAGGSGHDQEGFRRPDNQGSRS